MNHQLPRSILLSGQILSQQDIRSILCLYWHYIAYLEHVVRIDKPKPIKRRLKVIQSLPHVTLSCEHKCLQTIVSLWHLYIYRKRNKQ